MKKRSTAAAYTEKKNLIKNLLQLHSTVENTTEYPDNLPENGAMAGSMPRPLDCYRETWWLFSPVHDLPPFRVACPMCTLHHLIALIV